MRDIIGSKFEERSTTRTTALLGFISFAACALACSSGGGDTTTVSAAENPAVETAEPAQGAPALGTQAELGREGVNQCGGPVERNLANLAAAAAEQLGRWEFARDFRLSPDGARLELSDEGAAHCSSNCGLVKRVLGLQGADTESADNDPAAFATALVEGWRLQSQTDASSQPLAEHRLERIGGEPSACGALFWYSAEKADCSGNCGLEDPAKLSTKLLFAGYPDNPYLQFQSALDFQGKSTPVVGIDPTYGLDEDGTVCPAATCRVGCVMISLTPPGSCDWCCSCNGVVTTWKKSPVNAITYLCQ